MTLLVDTDWIISGIIGRAEAIALFNRLSDETLAVSVVTMGEIMEGAYDKADVAATLATYRRFLAGFVVFDVTAPVVAEFGRLRALLRKQGNLIPDLDLLIASTALALDIALVTRNRRHFARVPDLKLHEAG